jgi:predicted permease
MFESVLIALFPIVILGWGLRYCWDDAEIIRQAINKLVINVLLPALVLKSVLSYPLDRTFLAIPAVSFLTIIISVVVSLGITHFLRIPKITKGAFVLAAAFGNVTFLGLPLLQGIYPEATLEVAKVSILFEITQSILELTLGVLIAIYFGSNQRLSSYQILREALLFPPLLILLVAVAWRLAGLPDPTFLINASTLLAAGVGGLMLLSMGMALRFKPSSLMLLVIPVVIIKLVIGPLVVGQLLPYAGLTGLDADASVLEAAMPTALFSLVIASRYKLDEKNLSFFVLVDTLIFMAGLPLMKSYL